MMHWKMMHCQDAYEEIGGIQIMKGYECVENCYQKIGYFIIPQFPLSVPTKTVGQVTGTMPICRYIPQKTVLTYFDFRLKSKVKIIIS
jgi:hypothetical protein